MIVSLFRRENRGKLFLIAATVLMWLLILIGFKTVGYRETWQLWNVPAADVPFLDFRLIPGSAESFRNGFEPTVKNPYDPVGRIFNYPAFWRLFFYTGITMDDTVWIVVPCLVLYFLLMLALPQQPGVGTALAMLLVAFSPAAMLLYERGNADLFVFILCAFALFALDRSAYWAAGVVVFGGVVKMFPLFGLTILLRETRQNFWRLVAGSTLFMVIYGLLTFSSQRAAWNTTMRGDGLSYGSFVVVTRLGKYLQDVFPVNQWKILFELLAVVLILLAGILALRDSSALAGGQERNLAAFRMGASMYVGTFLLGNNWDYRLAFLVLVIPQLAEWCKADQRKHSAVAVAVLAGILVSCWHLMVKVDMLFIPLKDPVNRAFIFDELVNWLLVPGFTYLLFLSLPEWLKNDLRKIPGLGLLAKPSA